MGMESDTLKTIGLVGGLGAQVVGTVAQAGAAKKKAEYAIDTRDFEIASKTVAAESRSDTYEYQAAVAANNELLAKWNEAQARERGQIGVARIGLSVRQLEGKQRAEFAARGIDVNEGSALAILDDTRYMGAVDVATAEHNTELEAYGFKVAALNAENDAALLKMGAANARKEAAAMAGAPRSPLSPNAEMFGTLLTGAGTVAKNWYDASTRK